MSAGYFGPEGRQKLGIASLHHGLITASHILHHHGIFDAYGHISVRNADDPSRSFLLSQNLPPALVASSEDIVEYRIEDAEPVEQGEQRPGFVERYIHSEIYKRFPGVNCVVHSHCDDVLPYCVNGVPLKPMVHMTGFLGATVPVWDSYGSAHDMLISNISLGASLSAAFRPASSATFLYDKVRSALPQLGSSQSTDSSQSNDMPSHSVVLMRGHGFATAAEGIEQAVFQAIYTKEAAKAQSAALITSASYFGDKGVVEGKVVEGSGAIKSGRVQLDGAESTSLHFLSDKDIKATSEMARKNLSRAWKLWSKEVEVYPLYQNEVKQED